MFVFLDTEAKRNPSPIPRPTLTSTGISLFKSCVFDKKKGAMSSGIQALINRLRDGEVVDLYVPASQLSRNLSSCPLSGRHK